jgi:hypothetical protein
MTCIASMFVGKTYKSTISGDCCIWTSDTYECYGMSANCNSAGPFTGAPSVNIAGCFNAQNSFSLQLTFCASI